MKEIPTPTREEIINLMPKRLREMRESGLTQEQIGEKCGVNQAVISRRLKEYKIK